MLRVYAAVAQNVSDLDHTPAQSLGYAVYTKWGWLRWWQGKNAPEDGGQTVIGEQD